MRWVVLIGCLVLCGCGEKPIQAKTWSVVAELEEVSDFPTVEEIRPYRDALIAHRYRIIEWKDEKEPAIPESKGLAIYHWAIIEEKATEAAKLKQGDVIELEIQRMIDRPDLKGRYRKNSLDAFDLQEFFAVESSPARSEKD